MNAWGFNRIREPPYKSWLALLEEWHELEGDSFPPWREWPQLWVDMLLKQHKDRRERYRLFLFLWANGMEPQKAVFWVMWHFTYDKSAWLSITDAANLTITVSGRSELSKGKVFIISEGKVL